MSQQPHSTTVTLVCLDSHEWQTTATDTGMARPFAKEDGTVSPGLCLSEIPSEAGVWPANSGCCSSHASSGATEKREKSTLRSANKTESRPVGIENRHTRPWAGIAASSGCASLVAVVKSTNLWYGNYGAAEFWRLHGPRLRRVLGQ